MILKIKYSIFLISYLDSSLTLNKWKKSKILSQGKVISNCYIKIY